MRDLLTPKPAGNTGDVESIHRWETAVPTEEEYEQIKADADQFMGQLKQEQVGRLVRLSKSSKRGRIVSEIEYLRESFDQADVNAVIASLSQHGVAVDGGTKLTRTSGGEGETTS